MLFTKTTARIAGYGSFFLAIGAVFLLNNLTGGIEANNRALDEMWNNSNVTATTTPNNQ